MNRLKVSLIAMLFVVAQGLYGMRPQNQQQPKPKTTTGQMREALRGINTKFANNFNRTVDNAVNNDDIGGVIGLRQEGRALIDNVYAAGEVVQSLSDDLVAPMEVGFELLEENLKEEPVKKGGQIKGTQAKAGFIPAKYRKQAREAITEMKSIAPKLATTAVILYLMWTYMQLPAQQEVAPQAAAPQTKAQALKAWFLKQCEPLVVKAAEVYGAAAGKAAAQQLVNGGEAPVPTQRFGVNGNGPKVMMHYPTQQVQAPVAAAPTIGKIMQSNAAQATTQAAETGWLRQTLFNWTGYGA